MNLLVCQGGNILTRLARLHNKFIGWLRDLFASLDSLFDSSPIQLTIVRRYADANGCYVGELYMFNAFAGVPGYRLVGCTLDAFPFDLVGLSLGDEPGALDLQHDFLAPMVANTFRVGALRPEDNDSVKIMIGQFAAEMYTASHP